MRDRKWTPITTFFYHLVLKIVLNFSPSIKDSTQTSVNIVNWPYKLVVFMDHLACHKAPEIRSEWALEPQHSAGRLYSSDHHQTRVLTTEASSKPCAKCCPPSLRGGETTQLLSTETHQAMAETLRLTLPLKLVLNHFSRNAEAFFSASLPEFHRADYYLCACKTSPTIYFGWPS